MDVLIPIIALISIFFVPITGLMLILVSRYALTPMVETLSAALRDSRQPDAASLVQMQALVEQIEELTDEVRRLQAGQEFDRQLLNAGGDGDAAAER